MSEYPTELIDHAGDEVPREQRTRPRRPGRHPVDVGHLVMGVAFAGLTVVWALIQFDAVELDETSWLLPLPWLAAGAAGLLATVFRSRPPRTEDPYDVWQADWKHDLQQSKRAWKDDLRRSKQAWKDEVRRSHQAWRHGWRHGHPPADQQLDETDRRDDRQD